MNQISAAVGPSTASQVPAQKPTFQTYQSASRASPAYSKGVVKVDNEGMRVKDAFAVVEDLKVIHLVDDWTDNMRLWLSEKVAKPLSSRLKNMDILLKNDGLNSLCTKDCHWNQSSKIQTTATNASATATTANPSQKTGFGMGFSMPFGGNTLNQKPATLEDLASKFSDKPWVQERLTLERFLNIPSYPHAREYMWYRIHDLATGLRLSQFVWNSGGSWGVDANGNPRKWTTSLPTDSEVIIHLFCLYMDSIFPGESPLWSGNQPFTCKYLLGIDDKPDKTCRIQIKCASKSPTPHFVLVVANTYWDLFPKRSNALLTLCLFVYYVNYNMGGYIGLLNLGSKSLGLQDVFYT